MYVLWMGDLVPEVLGVNEQGVNCSLKYCM